MDSTGAVGTKGSSADFGSVMTGRGVKTAASSVSSCGAGAAGAAGIAESVGGGDAKFEAIDAMTALGYSRSEAAQAVNAVAAEGMTTEDILKAALKRMITF